ncbi:MAG: hypothetical protein AB8G22_24385, partial [Saprospiraceae bacterium]
INVPVLGPNDAYEITYLAYSDTEQSITNTLEVMSHPGVDDTDSVPGNGIASEDDTDSATASWVAPSISLRKLVETESGSGTYIEADATDGLMGTYSVGQPVNYRFIIENTGSTSLGNVTLADNLTGFECDQTIGFLLIGETETIDCTWSYGFAASNDPYVNIATVTGTNTINSVTESVTATDSASIVVVPCNITPNVVAGDQTICLGEDPLAFTIDTPATGNGTLTYQWQRSTTDCTTGFSNISGATSEIYDVDVLNATTYYRVIVTNTNGSVSCQATSNCLTITVEDPIQITAATQNCEDNSTGGLDADDYFSITFTATSTNPGAANQYAVYNGAELLASGITYGNSVNLEWANAAMNQRFSADNSSVYTLTIQDLDNSNCSKDIMTTAQPSCSICPAQVCLPVTIEIRRTN